MAFDAERAVIYDKQTKDFFAGYEALHETSASALGAHLRGREAPLVALVGVGTGNEAVRLADRHPDWKLVGVDPSGDMLAVARQKVGERVEFREGTLDQFPDLRELDAVLMIGVLHHLPSRAAQQEMVCLLSERLRPGGILVFGCQVGPYAPGSLRDATMLERWREFGATEESIAERRTGFGQHSLPLDPEELRDWLTQAGFQRSERLFATLYFEVWAADGISIIPRSEL